MSSFDGRTDVNELDNREMESAFVSYACSHVNHPRQFAIKHPLEARQWLLSNVSHIYKVIGLLTMTQSKSARSGVETRQAEDSDSEEESEEEESESSDDSDYSDSGEDSEED